MITFSATITAAMQLPSVEAFYLVDFNGYRSTTHFVDVTLSDGSVYLADNRLIQIDPPRMSTTVDREIYKIALADPDMTFGTQAEEGIVGKPISVRLGVVNQATGLPYTNVADTILVYKGAVDNGSYEIDTAEIGSAIFNISCSSPMADLDMTKALLTAKTALANIDPSDTSFSQVYEGSGQIQLKWGKG
jgi:hypothetical protein